MVSSKAGLKSTIPVLSAIGLRRERAERFNRDFRVIQAYTVQYASPIASSNNTYDLRSWPLYPSIKAISAAEAWERGRRCRRYRHEHEPSSTVTRSARAVESPGALEGCALGRCSGLLLI